MTKRGRNLNFGNSFIVSTELVSLLLGLLVYFFAGMNHPRRTIDYKTLMAGVHTLMVELYLELAMEAYVVLADNVSRGVINAFAVLLMLLHTTVGCILLIYVLRLSDMSLNIKKLNYIVTTIIILTTLIGLRLIFKGNMYNIDGNTFEMVYLYSYMEFICIVPTLIFYGTSIANRKCFSRPLFTHIAIFVPIIMAMQVAQIIIHTKAFSGIIYMIPFSVLFFIYHNDPYDIKTGAREFKALEGYFDAIFFQEKPYDFIDINMDIAASETKSSAKEVISDYWKFCRRIEYLDNSISLYKISPTHIILLYSIENEYKRLDVKKQIKEGLEALTDRYCTILTVYAFVITENDFIKSMKKGKELQAYIEKRHVQKNYLDWEEVSNDTYVQFSDYYNIKNALLDIDDKCDLNDERILCYAQPIYNIEEGCFKNAEALTRMMLNGIMVPPVDFISIAEEINTIHSITKIMLNKICKFVAANKKNLDLDAISFNCSMLELAIPGAADEFLKIMEDNMVEPGKIRMEITETAELDTRGKIEVAALNLRKLYTAGIKTYLDDYGTGYSNLTRVTKMKMQTIKFDRSIFQEAYRDKTTEGLMDAMINTFKNKGYRVLVEGVETAEQAEYAKEHGFEFIQGFYYARPEPIENLVNKIEARVEL